MDFERLKRVNELARDLVLRGIATDPVESTRMAERMLSGESVPIDLQTMKPKQREVTPPVKTESLQQPMTFSINEETIKNILAKNTETLLQAVREVRTKIDLLNKDIVELKNAIAALPVEPQHTLKEFEKEPNPRQGYYKSEDVAVEKMFYAGKK